MPTMKMRLVKRPRTDPKGIHYYIIRDVENFMKSLAFTLQDSTQENWRLDKDRADFSAEHEISSGKIVFQILLTAEAAESATLSVWQLLEGGTKKRPMHLSKEGHPAGPWRSKTVPKILISNEGAGEKVGIWKPYDRGIKKRDWVETMSKEYKQRQDTEVRIAIENALDLYFSHNG